MNFSKLKQGESIAFNQTLTIKLIEQSDLQDIIDMLGDDKVNKYLFFAPADDSLYKSFFGPIIEDTQKAISEQRWPENPTFIIRDQQGKFMGMTAITQVMFLSGNFEIGFQLPFHAWGQGIATQSTQLLTELGFNYLNAHKISGDCYGSNTGSFKTFEKCGYELEGRQTDYFKMDNGFDDKVYYGLSKAQFMARAID